VSFNQSIYTIGEGDGSVQPVLLLSNPSSAVITVEVFSTDINALGK